jgi:hypothetical protein
MTTRFGVRGLCGAVAAALFLGFAHPTLAHDQPQWVRQLGTSELDEAYGAATDGDGNVYISGSTLGGALGGPNQGLWDAWLAKYSPAGAVLWKRQFGTSESDLAFRVATDSDGNVYITGGTFGSLGRRQQGNGDAWVAKYSAAGALRWKRQLGTFEQDWANAWQRMLMATSTSPDRPAARWAGPPKLWTVGSRSIPRRAYCSGSGNSGTPGILTTCSVA